MSFIGKAVSGLGHMVGGALGLGSGGQNFQAQGVDVLQPATLDQTKSAYDRSQQGLNYQQQFVNAMNGMQGLQNQAGVFSQQQGLANQLQGVANGTGPNPALAQLNETTARNIAQQGALMAGQRGANANVGLLARQAGRLGGDIQQQASGQAATLGAQQQLAAMGALQQQQASMGNLANQQVAQQMQGLQGYSQSAQSQQQQLLDAINQYNANRVGMQSNINSSNAGVQAAVAKDQGAHQMGFLGNLGDSLGGIANTVAGAFGGGAQATGTLMGNPISMMMAQGGAVPATGGARSRAGQYLNASKGAVVPGSAKVSGNSLKNDTVPAMLSPKEIVLPRSVTLSPDAPNKAKAFVEALLQQRGGAL
jgi:hypothetical protein